MSISLANLEPSLGTRKNKKRVGRGTGSGNGKTAGKGHKGAKARSGGGIRPGFEGGQMPIQRRLPKRGFKSLCKDIHVIVNIKQLDKCEDGSRVDKKILFSLGIINSVSEVVKILGRGMLQKKLIVVVDKYSKNAKDAIEATGGRLEDN